MLRARVRSCCLYIIRLCQQLLYECLGAAQSERASY